MTKAPGYRMLLRDLAPDAPFYESAEDVPDDARSLVFKREGRSHRGIGRLTTLTHLEAAACNQDMLEEISGLQNLVYLDLAWPFTGKDLAPLGGLTSLEVLKIDSPRALTDFSPVTALPALKALFVTNAKHLETLDFLAPLSSRLRVLGVEGSMWTRQSIASLAPLRGFALEALFLTNTALGDQDLSPLTTMPDLKLLETGINAPRAEFMALARACPNLVCTWFDGAAWAQFRDPRPPRG